MAHSITLPFAALLLAFVASATAQQVLREQPHDQKERALWVQKDFVGPRPVHPIRNNREIHSRWHSMLGEFKIHQRNRKDIRVLNTHREYGVRGVKRPDAVIVFSDNYPGHHWNVRTDGTGGQDIDVLWGAPVMASPLRIVKGLALGEEDNSSPNCLDDLTPGCVVSFIDEERSYWTRSGGGYYLRHTDRAIVASKDDETPGFAEAATWIIREALDKDPDARSYESVNFPNNYVRHHAYRLRLHSSLHVPMETFHEDCSFETLNVQDLLDISDKAPPKEAD